MNVRVTILALCFFFYAKTRLKCTKIKKIGQMKDMKSFSIQSKSTLAIRVDVNPLTKSHKNTSKGKEESSKTKINDVLQSFSTLRRPETATSKLREQKLVTNSPYLK